MLPWLRNHAKLQTRAPHAGTNACLLTKRDNDDDDDANAIAIPQVFSPKQPS